MSDVVNQVCVCEPGYITEFVRNVLHMCEQTIIIMLFFLAHKKLSGTLYPQVLCTLGLTCVYNSQITQWGGITNTSVCPTHNTQT